MDLCVRRSVHFRRQQLALTFEIDNPSPVSADRFISDVSNPDRFVPRFAVLCVRRSVHFRRQQLDRNAGQYASPGVRRSVHFRRQQQSISGSSPRGSKCPPIGSFPTSATGPEVLADGEQRVSADRFISDVSNRHSSNSLLTFNFRLITRAWPTIGKCHLARYTFKRFFLPSFQGISCTSSIQRTSLHNLHTRGD